MEIAVWHSVMKNCRPSEIEVVKGQLPERPRAMIYLIVGAEGKSVRSLATTML
jgi:hypothetical protein